MNTNIGENIKFYRKKKSLTQEQLAEAIRVTKGAVHKWETQLSIPDIQIIMELADFFEISVDVLLGFHLNSAKIQAILDRITQYQNANDWEKAIMEAEKAVKKYPYNFEVIYKSASVYLAEIETSWDKGNCLRAIELLNRSCSLLEQNKEAFVNEVTINKEIAKTYIKLGEVDRALELLKQYNICGIHNAYIGMVYGDIKQDADESEKYLGKAFKECIDNLDSIMIGYINVFFQRKDYKTAIDCVQWLRNMFNGIQPETKVCYYDKYDCVLLTIIAETYCFMKKYDQTEDYLKQALEKAVTFDRKDDSRIHGIELFETMKIQNLPNYDFFGKTAMECLENRIRNEQVAIPELGEIWQKVKREMEI